MTFGSTTRTHATNEAAPRSLALSRLAPMYIAATSVALLLGSLATPPARGDVTYPEVHEVEADPAAYLGRSVSLVGRFDSAANQHLRLVDSKIDFVIGPTARKPAGGAEHLRVSGQLRRVGEGLRFDVNFLTTTASEADEFAARRAKIEPGDAEALYALSRWVRARGEWYKDRHLLRLAAQAFRQAFRVEEENIAATGDSEALLAHAARGERLNLEAADVARIRHRAFWLALTKDEPTADAPPKDEAYWHALAQRIAELFPGANEPPGNDAPTVDAKYWNDPVAAYDAADPASRAAMHRAIWSEAMIRGYDATRSGGDADALALFEDAERNVPERTAWLHDVELVALDARSSRLDELTRTELDEIRAGYQRLGKPDRAQAVADGWLAARRDALVENDADGRIRLAVAYRDLAGDDRTAAALYIEALAISPNLPEARRGATELGYRKIFGRWRNPDELSEAERIEWQREQEGRIEPGDSEQDVVRRFRRPDRISRTVTSASLVEKWIYEGPPPLEIYLRRRAAGGDAIVTAVASP